MFLIEYRSFAWWYWLASVVLIAFGVAGSEAALATVIFLSFIQIIHFAVLEKSLTSFSVQVRISFAAVMLLCFFEPLRWLYWWPLIGLSARVLFSYCFLARTISLAPWNRKAPLSLSLVKETYLSKPVRGSILK